MIDIPDAISQARTLIDDKCFDEAISHYRESIRADKQQTDASLRLALLAAH